MAHSLDKECRKIIGKDMRTVQLGWPLGMPLVRSLNDGLWEIRFRLPNNIARIIFKMIQGEMVLLHGFIKKLKRHLLKIFNWQKNELKNMKQ